MSTQENAGNNGNYVIITLLLLYFIFFISKNITLKNLHHKESYLMRMMVARVREIVANIPQSTPR